MLLLSLTAAAAPVPEGSLLNSPDRPWQVEPVAEIGFLAPFSNSYQSGKEGTEFNYVEEGGQDNLFLVARLSLDVRWSERNAVTFLYQPLDVRTEQVANRDLVLDNLTYPTGTPINFRYGFDFYRLSYSRDVLEDPNKELAFGGSIQIRNATINTTSSDGELRATTRDIGPVPVLKTRGRFDSESGAWWGFEVDGFYAPIKYLNGGKSDVVGAIADASLRAGVTLEHGIEPFLNLRYITGGSEGTSTTPDPGKDGYNRNWLHLGTLTIGFLVR